MKLSELNIDSTSNLFNLIEFKRLFHVISGFPVQVIFDHHALCTGSSVLRCLAKHLTLDNTLTAIPNPDLDIYVTAETDLVGLLTQLACLCLDGKLPSVAIKHPSVCICWKLASNYFTLDINCIEWDSIGTALDYICYSCTKIIYDGTDVYLHPTAYQSILDRKFFITEKSIQPVSNLPAILSKYYQRGFSINDNISLLILQYLRPLIISDYSYAKAWMPLIHLDKIKLSDHLKDNERHPLL